MVKTAITLRMYSKDWRAIRQAFPAEKDELICSYLSRLAEEVRKWKQKK